MKKIRKVKKINKVKMDIEVLKHWKSLSTETVFKWLEEAIRFGKFKKF